MGFPVLQVAGNGLVDAIAKFLLYGSVQPLATAPPQLFYVGSRSAFFEAVEKSEIQNVIDSIKRGVGREGIVGCGHIGYLLEALGKTRQRS